MAKPPEKKTGGAVAFVTQTARSWWKGREQSREISPHDEFAYDISTASMLLGSSKKPARSRIQIYEKWQYMASDPLCASALSLHATQALGGHEQTGQSVFIEDKPTLKDGTQKQIVEDLRTKLLPIFNRIAQTVAFNGAAFGDAYGRVYSKPKVGVTDVYVDELVYPPLVQSYEKGAKTVGYRIATGPKFTESMTIAQVARMKMPRKNFVPQMRVLEKAARIILTEDDPEALPAMPSSVGGSFLYSAEEAYDDLMLALTGMKGQRIKDSLDEVLVGTQLDGATLEQKEMFMDSLEKAFQSSVDRFKNAFDKGEYPLGRTFHFIPTFGDKQSLNVTPVVSGSAASVSIEDVMFYAKRLSGALGIDLSMLGFADLLSGGFGDGGFFRTSAQAAERSRVIRNALVDFFHQIIDIHTLTKYGWYWESNDDRPYDINFYGSISALETEKQKNNEVNANRGLVLLQAMDMLRNGGYDAPTCEEMLELMGCDEPEAKLFANGIKNAKPPAPEGGGGFGGGDMFDSPPIKEVQGDNELDESYKKD